MYLSLIHISFTAGGSYTVPAGYTRMDLFAVGGGSSGNMAQTGTDYNNTAFGGGAGGYTKTVTGIVAVSYTHLVRAD